MGGLDPNAIRAIAVCTVFFLAIIGAIVMALLDHQRKMAQIIREDRENRDGLDARVDALQSDISELKSLLTAQAVSARKQDELQQRIG